MLFYRAALPLSHQTLTFVSDLIRAHRKQMSSAWRTLNPAQQALLVLVYLRKGEPFADVGAGFDVSTTTCWRYVNETAELLAQRAPKRRTALRRAKRRAWHT
ncbi:DDE superfamily endonuclease [Kutzneria buriramensis]|uniref:DDE superfamily endonuclease n=1 Tax=Kutzneria buriramensis TaxID=1045776 RepID=A0A3E0G5E0_9PSEU|nr:DDE superfamily endonuclease [Kutzneria buriramensis]